MATRPTIALVSREVAPFGGGGIGTYVCTTAEALAPVADVTIFTTERHRKAYEAMRGAGDPRVAGLDVRFVPEPRAWNVSELDTHMQLWSSWAFQALVEAFPDGGPDLVEFPDFLGEGFAAAQARRTLDRRLRNTTICVRLYTTAEMTSILDGYVSDDFSDRVTYELERYALARCDHVLWPGGDVLGTYQRRLGSEGVASPVRVRHALTLDAAAVADPGPPAGADSESPGAIATEPPGERTRLLYIGRLERRKGVLDLARAVAGIWRDDFSLTLLGGDTDTAPLQQSMRAMLELMFGRDQRIEFVDHVSRSELPALISAHDVVVLPSLWECWPAVGLEALERNRPLLTTPAGGFTEIVQRGRSGWHTASVGPEALARAIEDLLDHPERRLELVDGGGPRKVFEELTDVEEIRAAYLELCEERPVAPAPARPRENPLVSVVIPYYRLDRFIEAAIESAFEQTYPRIEAIVVNDGSFRGQDSVLAELAERYPIRVLTQVNSGLGAARNAGVTQARGRYVVFLDADNILRPAFTERAVAVLEANPDFAYVTSWSRYIDDDGKQWGAPGSGYRPLGNWNRLVHEDHNTSGDAAALYRRALFVEEGLWFSQELTSFEDWAYYRRLHARGRYGEVIPEHLLDYRVRGDSMLRETGSPNKATLFGEMRAYVMEEDERWISPSA